MVFLRRIAQHPIVTTGFDGLNWHYISDSLRGPAAQDVNAFAILFGVAPADQWNSILQKLKTALYTGNGPLAFDPKSGFTISGNPDTLFVNGQKVKSETAASETAAGRPGYAYVRDLAPGTYRIGTSADSK